MYAPHLAADGALARIRLPGGAISAAAMRAVAGCAADLGDGDVHLTSRGNLQLRGLDRADPRLAERLTAAGLLPSASHERVRNILASPLSPTAGELAVALDRELCARPALAALPGRFLFAVDGGSGDVAAEDPDLCWLAPSALVVGGVEVGLEVPAGRAVAALLAAAEAFLGLRAATSGAGAWRVHELPDAPARIAAAVAHHLTLAGPQPDHDHRPPTPLIKAQALPDDLQPQHLRLDQRGAAVVPGPAVLEGGGVGLVVAPVLGQLTATQVRALADTAPRAVVTPWRTIVLVEPGPDPLDPGPAPLVSACAGRPGCAKALADVRADARAAIAGGETRRAHYSGCERRCGAPKQPHVDMLALASGGYEAREHD